MRAAAGFAIACAIAAAAHRARALSRDGAGAAVAVGTAAMAAGWKWGALLLFFFLSSTLLSRAGAGIKAARAAGMLDKGGSGGAGRDAIQVLANGGVFALAALLSLTGATTWWGAVAAGALAASTADTWATEVGMLARQAPRSITSGRVVPVGASGGVTVAGSIAMVLGALAIGAAAAWGSGSWYGVPAVWAGGVAGAVADSLLGATVQERRHCPRCRVWTEARRHECGSPTDVAGGVPGLDNDRVNLACALIGGLVAGLAA